MRAVRGSLRAMAQLARLGPNVTKSIACSISRACRCCHAGFEVMGK